MLPRTRQYLTVVGLVLVLIWLFSALRSPVKAPQPNKETGKNQDDDSNTKVVKFIETDCPPVPVCEKAQEAAPLPGGNNLPRRRKNILVNFGHNCCEMSKKRNCETGLKTGGFDVCHSFSMDDVDRDFYERHKGTAGFGWHFHLISAYQMLIPISDILTQRRGGGYWLWKPYMLFKVLRESQEGDIIFYSDAGAYFVKNVEPLLNLADEKEIVSFQLPPDLIESTWTKRDTFKLLNVDAGALKWSGWFYPDSLIADFR